MRSTMMASIAALLVAGQVSGGADMSPIKIRAPKFDQPQVFGRSSNKDRNSGGNRLSQKKLRIRARRAGF